MNGLRMDTRVKVIERIAQEASQLALDYFRQLSELEICEKRPQDVFSEADQEVEKLIRQRLAQYFPMNASLAKSKAANSVTVTGRSIRLMAPVTFSVARRYGAFLSVMSSTANRSSG